jgi:murein DD-endopeptidase MepM/ murein hydrolase activator NlpD
MNVIVFSKRMGRAQQFEVNRLQVLALTAILLLGVMSIAFLAGSRLGPNRVELESTAQVLKWSREIESQRAEVLDSRRELQDRLDALARQVGQMSAEVIRLEALGRRLTEMAGLEEGEFNFDEPPAQGGPEAVVEGALAVAPDLNRMLEELSRQIEDRERQLGVLETLLSSRNLSEQIVPGGRPVNQGWISSYFGMRPDPFSGRKAFHRGIDFAGQKGAEIVAVAAGVVTWSRERYGFGKMVEINHGGGYVTRYAHNQENLVEVGDTVQKGQAIALMGSSGRSTGPHLHFEVLKDGRPVNPITFVKR